ncbi:MAG TPA: TlpA disulfide reductase family protein [Acidimicrobiales bacterium]|nr:TlpA disulfide reductase family protein [Acidimicrobiales bacterium]
MTPLSRSRLPWQAVVAATVLAVLAALAVVAVLGGGDPDDGVTTGSDSTPSDTLQLTPAEDAATGEPLDIPVAWPDGAEVALAEVIEGPTVVNFFASWCPPCIAEMPDFESVSQEAGDDVEFIGVAVQDRTADATRIVEDTGVTYRWARDARGDVANAAQVTQMPSTMFVDADGEVVSLHAGALDADQLRDLLESELGVTVG